jgi:hypothetical protein
MLKFFWKKRGITEEVKNGFIVSLLSHMRPINEVLIPYFIDNWNAFNNQFAGMTDIAFSYENY